MSADYGLRSKSCFAHGSLHVVKNLCEGKGSCSVKASNGVFGDPCRGVRKYLKIRWDCVPPHH